MQSGGIPHGLGSLADCSWRGSVTVSGLLTTKAPAQWSVAGYGGLAYAGVRSKAIVRTLP